MTPSDYPATANPPPLVWLLPFLLPFSLIIIKSYVWCSGLVSYESLQFIHIFNKDLIIDRRYSWNFLHCMLMFYYWAYKGVGSVTKILPFERIDKKKKKILLLHSDPPWMKDWNMRTGEGPAAAAASGNVGAWKSAAFPLWCIKQEDEIISQILCLFFDSNYIIWLFGSTPSLHGCSSI